MHCVNTADRRRRHALSSNAASWNCAPKQECHPHRSTCSSTESWSTWSGRIAALLSSLDGYAFHHNRTSFERDRERDATLQLEDYRVLRITSRRLDRETAVVMKTLRRLLSRPA